jgi:hypothetical protein
LALLSLCCLGCGDQYNQSSIQVSGTIKHGDEPVPSGAIKFSPVSGNGRIGFAKIKDGTFDTASSAGPSQGVEKGRYRVEVVGFSFGLSPEDEPEQDGVPNGTVLFPPHRFEHDFQADEKMEIVVPKK